MYDDVYIYIYMNIYDYRRRLSKKDIGTTLKISTI